MAKILIASDTHSKHSLLRDLPEADIFIHAGDFMKILAVCR
jgi:predicted phosphodiesterase